MIKLKNIPPKEQEACKNEVELLSRMCHPNIVGYTNSFLYKNCLCIIMEYCDAGDLGDRVNEAKVCAWQADRQTDAGYLALCLCLWCRFAFVRVSFFVVDVRKRLCVGGDLPCCFRENQR